MRYSILILACFVAGLATVALPRAGAASVSAPANPVNPSPDLLGDWRGGRNGVVRAVVSPLQPGWVRLAAYGACAPSPCRWGGIRARLFAENAGSGRGTGLTATYDHGFSLVTVTAHLTRRFEPPMLRVETYTRFVDGSGRSDYWDSAYLRRP